MLVIVYLQRSGVKIWLSAKDSTRVFLPIMVLTLITLPGRVVIMPSLQTLETEAYRVKWHKQDSAAKKWAVGI